MTDLGRLKYFIGIEVLIGPEGIFLCQRKYALDIVTETGNLGCTPAHTPLDQNHQLAKADGRCRNPFKKKKKKREWSSMFVVVESRVIRIDREALKYEVGEEVIVCEL